ncbi:MAG: ABC transporter substrate-binding protein [bacterium]|nr:ABC transporter substrate-binding protein [bacterium]
MHGNLKHKANFKQFGFVNPDAPKGGRLVYGAIGGFDSLNPFIVRGRPAPNLRNYIFESLMTRAYDEPFSLYGLLAETIDTPEDRSWVAFKINKNARFSDGKAVTIEDIIHSHALLRDMGRPNHRFYYSKVTKVEKIGSDTVKFTFKPEGDREMPLIMGLMPILPKHIYSKDSFEINTLKAPTGSGPYLVDKIDAGSSISFKRNPNYWGRDLAVNKGRYNLDHFVHIFYRDANVLFEDFKKGVHHIRLERDPNRWAKDYNFPAMKKGLVKRQTIKLAIPSGMNALVFNTRRPVFADRSVREALTLIFDFEWINRNLYHNLYTRTRSFFDRSELSSGDKPVDEYEQSLLSKYPDAVTKAIQAKGYEPPVSDGYGRNRNARRRALRLLIKAGYVLKGAELINKSSGKPFTFEILTTSEDQVRLLLNYVSALKLIGIKAKVRVVDSAQFQQRKNTFDFDMTDNEWRASLSPGNEQSFRWSAKAADSEGSYNFAGVKNPAADAMITALLMAKSRKDFVSSVRALDRVLLSGNYVIPLYHTPGQWLAIWSHLKHPANTSLYGLRLDTIWQQPDTK